MLTIVRDTCRHNLSPTGAGARVRRDEATGALVRDDDFAAENEGVPPLLVVGLTCEYVTDHADKASLRSIPRRHA